MLLHYCKISAQFIRGTSNEKREAVWISHMVHDLGGSFYLGGKREQGSPDFYWVDSTGGIYGTSLVDPSNWASGAWGSNVPSYTSEGYEETVCGIFKYQGRWILNDEPLNMLWTAPEYSEIIV